MGTSSVKVTIANTHTPTQRSTIELLVDTRSLFSFLPELPLQDLGILPTRREDFTTISGAIIHRNMGHALFVLDGKEAITPVVFAEGKDIPVLGALTLEALGFLVDPIGRTLVRRQTFPAACALFR